MHWRCDARRTRSVISGAAVALGVLVALASASAGAAPGPAKGARPEDRAESAAWRRTLERITSAVVAIKVDGTRAFDTEWNETAQATGFVVDAERGLILTNRHVVSPGPVRAEALFVNQEEVELTPVYRDPVHDFGFFRYDPAKLRYIKPVALPLAPAAAQLGREIRVVGNDAGEQLSILSGTIARLRRAAPDYGRGNYNDFNTFYLQAASSTSGGSSGSPVIDIDGRVVALNAGASSEAASSFFLPLDRVSRALALLREGQPVARGTLATVFSHEPFDELRRLGLPERVEADVRRLFPTQTGMLVVNQVIPGSVADGRLRVGDVLVKLDQQYLAEFAPLESWLDAHVGRPARMTVSRNAQLVDVVIDVADLHAITPAEYLEFGDAVVHKLSFQQARHYNRPVDGVFVANPGYVLGSAGIPRASVIVSVNEAPIHTLDDMEQVLASLADRQRATVRFYTFEDSAASKVRVMRMDRRWFPAHRCHRDDSIGIWPCRPLAEGPPAPPPVGGVAQFPAQSDKRLDRIARSLVVVNFDMPYTIAGVSERHYYGTGVIVDAEHGYVAVDRNTVPEAMGDVQITFGGSLEVPGRVVFIHPTHNLALVAYDPKLIGATPVASARFTEKPLAPGERVEVVGLRADFRLVYRTTEVATVEPVQFPLSRTIRFRDSNLETIELVNGPTDIDGVILNRDGDVAALWSSFAFQGQGELSQENKGIPAGLVAELTRLGASGEPLHSVEVEWVEIPLSAARKLGLPDEWARKLRAQGDTRPQVLSVARTVAGTPAAALLQPGDILLDIDGRPATQFRDVEAAVQKREVLLQIFRAGHQLPVNLPTVALDGAGVRRAVMWSGALIQAPYRDMAAQRGVERVGVYVAFFSFGSPASRFGLTAGRRVTEVDGQPIRDLDEFLGAVRNKRDRDSVRLTTVTWNNFTEILTLKLDRTYWPTYEVAWKDGDWRATSVSSEPQDCCGRQQPPDHE
jgi:S1-C subfamily serine protease